MDARNLSMYDIAEQKGKYFSKKKALTSKSQHIVYGEFISLVNYIAAGLKNEGLGVGDRIAILASNGIEYFALFFAAAKIGGITVPLNYRLSKSELVYVLKNSDPLFLFVEDKFIELAEKVLLEIPSIKKTFSMGERIGHFHEFQSISHEDSIADDYSIKGNDTFALIYTAALEGKARGAMISHDNLIISCLQMNSRLSLSERSVYLNLLPLFHIGGLLGSMMTFIAGGVNVFIEKFDPEVAVELIKKEKITYFFSFPPMLGNMLDKLDNDSHDISSLKYVIGLEEIDTIIRLENCSNAKFWNVYGQTETAGFISSSPFDNRPGVAGSLHPIVSIKIIDDYGQEVDLNEPGEIIVRGPIICNGYWKLEAETEFLFKDEWLHTGDLGRIDEEGFLWYLGRKPEKELIKPGGENVYPKEVEKVIVEHPAVEEVSVIGVPDPKWGEGIKAVCVLKDGAKISPKDISVFVGSKIAHYKKPQYVQFVASLPKNEKGKIDRKKVKAEYGSADDTNRIN